MPAKGQFKRGAKKRSVYQRKYNSKPTQKKRRAVRNAARKKAMKAGRVKKGDGKDIDHKDRRGLSYGSTQVLSKSKNRAKNSHFTKKRRSRSR